MSIIADGTMMIIIDLINIDKIEMPIFMVSIILYQKNTDLSNGLMKKIR